MKRLIFVGVCLCVLTFPHGYLYGIDYTWTEWPAAEGGNGHWYAATLDHCIWTDAEAEAITAGGHLVTVNNEAENVWLSKTFAGYYSEGGNGDPWESMIWIGLFNNGMSWEWISGEPITFMSEWWNGNPTGGGIHVYLHPDTHHEPQTWYNDSSRDIPDIHAYHPCGIIEVVPEPTMLSLMLLGGLAAMRKRKA